MEVECFEFFVYRIGVVDLIDGTVDLKTVIIHDHYQIVQLLGTGKHGCLPNLAFLYLAVSQQCIGSVGCTIKLCGKSHTYRGRDTLSERS